MVDPGDQSALSGAEPTLGERCPSSELPAPLLNAQGLAAVEGLGEHAACWTMFELVRRLGPPYDSNALKVRFQTREDLLYHIQFLSGALATGLESYFVDYVRWLCIVFESRGIAREALGDALRLIGEFYSGRLSETDAQEVDRILTAGLTAMDRPATHTADELRIMRNAWPEVDDFSRQLIAGDFTACAAIASAAAETHRNYVEIATRLFQPALYRIGEMWERNEISVAQEHLATELCRNLLARLLPWTTPFHPEIDRKALFAAVENDQHVLGLQVVSEAFHIAGWHVQYLGSNTPARAILHQVSTWQPDVVGLSVSLAQQLPTLKRTVDMLRGELGGMCPTILVGGRPTNRVEGIWRWTGADAWSPDAERAVAEVGTTKTA